MTRPWQYQKELQKEKVPSPEEIYNVALKIQSERTKALFVLGYLTGGRISELVGEKGVFKQGINRADRDGREIVLIDIVNLKNKKRHRKEIPVVIDREIEKKLFLLAYDYISKSYYDEPIFKFGKHWARKLLKKETGINPHFLRHIRATHLVIYYDFNEQLLRMFMGWSDTRPARHYMELRWTDMLQKL